MYVILLWRPVHYLQINYQLPSLCKPGTFSVGYLNYLPPALPYLAVW